VVGLAAIYFKVTPMGIPVGYRIVVACYGGYALWTFVVLIRVSSSKDIRGS